MRHGKTLGDMIQAEVGCDRDAEAGRFVLLNSPMTS